MKFIHVASYKDEFFSGIKSVLQELVPEQRKLGHEVHVFNQEYNENEVILGEQYISSLKEFKDGIKSICPDFVIFHSLYGLSAVRYSWYLKKIKIPYLVEPHGGTSMENAKKSKMKKKIANFVYANNFIHYAAGLIYLNKKEMADCVFGAIRRNGVVVPNGTRIHGQLGKSRCSEDVVKFVFLARIDIIQKGLDLLFPAIKEVNKRGALEKMEFHFYGKARNPQWGRMFDEYIASSDGNVFFHGSAIGRDKELAFKNNDVFILTSRYEGMPMAVLEALSYGVPCIVTPQTNMAELIADNHAGWVTTTDVQSIADTLYKAYNEYIANRESNIQNALNAVLPYDWGRIAQKSIQEYLRLISQQ